MSFNISVSGTKEDALKQLDAATGAGDQQHFEVCREALRAAITTVPDGTVLSCNASGHHDYNPTNPSGDFSLVFSVRKKQP